MNIYDAMRQFERSIKESADLKKYQELRKKIEADETTKEIMADIRKKQIEVQSYMMMGREIPEDKMEEFERVNQLVAHHQTINEFLQAEYIVGKIFEDISKMLGEAFDFWLPEDFKAQEIEAQEEAQRSKEDTE